jgi:hypothetical protein
VLLVDFSDGVERPTSIRWFIQRQLDSPKTDLVQKDAVFSPTTEMEGAFLVVELAATFDVDDIRRMTVRSSSPLRPSRPVMLLAGVEEPVEDVPITMIHIGEWLLSDPWAPTGFRLICEDICYTPTRGDIGKYVRFNSDMVDMIIGIVRPTLTPIRSVVLERQADQVGAIVTAVVEFYPGREAPFDVKWIRCCRREGDTVVQKSGSNYCFTSDDVDKKIRAEAWTTDSPDTSRDSEFTSIIKRGPFAGPIIVGDPKVGSMLTVSISGKVQWFHDYDQSPISSSKTFQITYFDVGHRIRIFASKKSQIYNELTEEVTQDPVTVGQTIDIKDIFHGDRDADYRNLWFRYDFASRTWIKESIWEGSSYALTPSDAGTVIRIVSITNDTGDEIFADVAHILGAEPVSPSIEFTAAGHLCLVGDVVFSKVCWRLWRSDGSEFVKDAADRKLIPHLSMIGCQIQAGYQSGDDKWHWTNKLLIESALPIPDVAMIESCPLVVSSLVTVQVTKTHKLQPRFKWKRWDGEAFIKIETPDPPSVYQLALEDIECYVCCAVCLVDASGRRSGCVSVETSGTVEALGIVGQAVCGALLQVVGCPELMDQASSFIWHRKDERGRWTEISQKISYRCGVDDVGRVVQVTAFVNGEETYRVTIGPIDESQAIVAKATELTKGGSFKFKGIDHDGERWVIEVGTALANVKGAGKAPKTVSLRDFEVKEVDRKIAVLAGPLLRVNLKRTVIPGQSLETHMARDVCVLAVAMLKRKGAASTPPQRKR